MKSLISVPKTTFLGSILITILSQNWTMYALLILWVGQCWQLIIFCRINNWSWKPKGNIIVSVVGHHFREISLSLSCLKKSVLNCEDKIASEKFLSRICIGDDSCLVAVEQEIPKNMSMTKNPSIDKILFKILFRR